MVLRLRRYAAMVLRKKIGIHKFGDRAGSVGDAHPTKAVFDLFPALGKSV
jgi:hypothetical protein